jgi:hypothetical protein
MAPMTMLTSAGEIAGSGQCGGWCAGWCASRRDDSRENQCEASQRYKGCGVQDYVEYEDHVGIADLSVAA